jgi:prolyl-tRNA synthetase
MPVKLSEIKKKVPNLLEEIQKNLFERSKKLFESKIEKADSLNKLKKIIEDKKVGIVPMCGEGKCEESMKAETKGAKALFISDKDKVKSEKCIICGKKADYFIYAGKSY